MLPFRRLTGDHMRNCGAPCRGCFLEKVFDDVDRPERCALALDLVVETGFDPALGARAMQRGSATDHAAGRVAFVVIAN